MEFEHVIHQRQSCRNFDSTKSIDKNILETIIKQGQTSPSATNSQPYSIYVATGESGKFIANARRLSQNKFIENCNDFIILAEDKNSLLSAVGEKLTDHDFKSIDIGILCQSICLAATNQGLDTCILGMFDEKKIAKKFGIKTRIRLIIAIGYRSEKEKQRDKKRKDYHSVVKWI